MHGSNNKKRTSMIRLITIALFSTALACAQDASENYRLGPGDRISVNLRNIKEIEIKPATLEQDGSIELQYVGRLLAEGMSTRQLATEIELRLKPIVRQPSASVEIIEYGSQPVSVLGAVNKPGVHQLRGSKKLVDVLSMAEGLKPEAGNVIKITRPKASGDIPLPNRKRDPTAEFAMADVNIRALLDASTPEANIVIKPHDVITVPRADLVYVLGNVRKPGGFPLTERGDITVLQAISLSEGIQLNSAPESSRILRKTGESGTVVEVPIDVKKILASGAPDQHLLPNDILYIPSSATKAVGLRALEAGLQIATGVVIWRR